jgi:uncharacterized membrane protein
MRTVGRQFAFVSLIICSLNGTLALCQQPVAFPGALGTYPTGMNDSGTIVGAYWTMSGTVTHGFIYTGGIYETIDYPGAMATYPNAINNSGIVVGYYTVPICNPDGDCPETHGFTYADGFFQSIDFPGASSATFLGINYNGIIIGVEHTPTTIPDDPFPTVVSKSFYFTRGLTNFVLFPAYEESGFYPTGINDNGFFIGFGDVSPTLHYSIGATGTLGSISPYAVPGYFTVLTGVDNNRDFVGYLAGPYGPDPFKSQAFSGYQGFLNTNNQVFTFPIPGKGTYFTGMNNNGQIVGYTDDGGGFSITMDQVIKMGTRLGEEFYTLPPCRVVDTRLAPSALGGPALQAGEKRTLDTAGVCGIPSTAAAVVMNVTVVPTAAGFLTLGPSDQALPNTSAINFNAGVVRANNAVIKMSVSGEAGLMVHNGSPGAVQLILDVSGFFQ